jgi:hypothetical protein
VVERAGIEPATSGLQSPADADDLRRRAATLADNHAGLRLIEARAMASLRHPVSGGLGHEWGTAAVRCRFRTHVPTVDFGTPISRPEPACFVGPYEGRIRACIGVRAGDERTV